MDVTFWVIQVVLLAPVLFMAASASKKDEADGPPPDEPQATESDLASRGPQASLVAQTRGAVTAPTDNLSQFSVEEQARLVLLRCLVEDARRRGAFTEDSRASDDELPAPTPAATPTSPVVAETQKAAAPRGSWRTSTQLVVASGALVMAAVGLAGVARTSGAIDHLEQASLTRIASVSPATRLLPGMLADPGKYMSALNTGGPSSGPGSGTSDPLFDAAFVDQKQAMDRWEAIIAIGLSLLLFVTATRAAPARRATLDASEEAAGSSVAFDLAPFVLVAAVLFAGLSFFEIP